MRNTFHKAVSKMTVAVVLTVVCCQTVYAEGPITTGAGTSFGGGGVDRVVQTVAAGYVGVSETVQIAAAYPSPPTNPANDNNDNAASYIGCIQGSLQAEGGIVWNRERQAAGIIKGWGAFLNVNGGSATSSGFSTPLSYTSGGWVPWRDAGASQGPNGGTSIHDISIGIDTNDGSVHLCVSGLGYFYASTGGHPQACSTLALAKSNDPYTTPFVTTDLRDCQVKCVIAMNRKSGVTSDPFFDDNSWMYAAVSNVNWTQVTTYGTDTGLLQYSDTQEVNHNSQVSGTGYDSFANTDARAKDLLDAHGYPTSKSQYRVNFPDTYCGINDPTTTEHQANEAVAREQLQASWLGTVSSNHNISRYTQEYVEIWLRKGAYNAPHPSRARARR